MLGWWRRYRVLVLVAATVMVGWSLAAWAGVMAQGSVVRPPAIMASTGEGAWVTHQLLEATTLTDEVFDTIADVADAVGRDPAVSAGWPRADIFVTVSGVQAGESVTWVPQLSADRVHWADVAYEWFDGAAIQETVPGRTVDEDGTRLMLVQLAGDYFNVHGVVSGTVTVEVWATYRYP